jgi:hypothetical protein
MSDIERNKQSRLHFLRAVYDLAAGNPSQVVDLRAVGLRMGWDFENRNHFEEALGYVHYLGGLGLITNEVEDGTLCRITAKGVDEVEGNRRESQPSVTNTFNMSGTFYQAAVGTHNTNTFSGDLDFSTVEQRIEDEGGADKEVLRELVREMRELLESGQTLDKGRLARFNDKLKEVPWLAGPVAGWLLNFATQELPPLG